MVTVVPHGARPRPLLGRLSLRGRIGILALASFSAAAVGAGLGRALLTTYLPVLLADIRDAPGLIGTVMLVNAGAGLVVPLAVGWWSDRLVHRGHGRVIPFVLGGSLLAGGGLAAVALGHGTTYLVLALAGGIAYVGLNAVTTTHRALIPERFTRDERSAATAAEEAAMLLGGLIGLIAGGLLVERVAWAAFALGAVAVPLLAVPTVLGLRRSAALAAPPPTLVEEPSGSYLRVALMPRVRLVLLAQALWVLAYLALPTFFVLYAERVLGLGPARAAVILAGAGAVTGVSMLLAGRTTAAHVRPVLIAGVLTMGLGLAAIAPASSASGVIPGLVLAAAGFGIVSTVGFPLFSLLIPTGEEGRYTALFFSVRSVASLAALPAAGWVIELSGSYRVLFAAGAVAALLAVPPLLLVDVGGGIGVPARVRALRRPDRRAALRWLAALAALTAAALAAGRLIAGSGLQRADEELLLAVHDVVPNPWLVDVTIVDPDVRNYALLTGLALLAAWRSQTVSRARAVAFVLASAGIAFAVVRAIWAVWERARPEEVVDGLVAAGHSFAPFASFPSGHAAVTVAMVIALARMFPRLALPLGIWAALVCASRVVYGAHFPSDVLVGMAVGVTAVALAERLLAAVAPEPSEAGPR